MQNNAYSLVACLLLRVLLAFGPGCAASAERHLPPENGMGDKMFKEISGTVAPENMGEEVLDKLHSSDGLTQEHLKQDAPAE